VRRLALLTLLVPHLALAQSSSDDDAQAASNYEPWSLRPGGFLQPQFRENAYSPTNGFQDGFRFARARLTATGTGKAGNLELSAYVETELQPQFSLFDAYATVKRALPHDGYIMVDVGQTRVPISRQQLMSDTRLSFVDKAQIGQLGIAPDRDLGLRVWVKPTRKDWLRVIAGAFNGEGRNQVQNINASYFYAARVEVTPLGRGHEMPFQESAFSGDWATVAFSIGRNKLTPGNYHQIVSYYGFDVSGSWHGLSASFEYLEVHNDFHDFGVTPPSPNYHANGFVAQIAYMPRYKLPPFSESRVEVGFRVEEYDRNDTIPITMPGDPNQSEREYTLALSYYLRQHLMKLQLAASHFDQIENKTVTGADATYNHDQLVLQLTYRVE
jgi:hypothetical protein